MNKITLVLLTVVRFLVCFVACSAAISTFAAPVKLKTMQPKNIRLQYVFKRAPSVSYQILVDPSGFKLNNLKVSSLYFPLIASDLKSLIKVKNEPHKICYEGLYIHQVIEGKGKPRQVTGCLSSRQAKRLDQSLQRLQTFAMSHNTPQTDHEIFRKTAGSKFKN